MCPKMGREVRHFSKYGQQVHERCSTSPIIKNMQIKIIMRYHLTTVRMAVITKDELMRMWKKVNTYTLLVNYKLVQPICETTWRFLTKLKIDLPCDSAISILGIYSQEMKTGY